MKTRIDDIENRNAPKVYEKLVKENAGLGANLVNRKVKEKYNYYICDYCGEEIKIKKKGNDQDGGTTQLPTSFKRLENKEVALHNRCLRPFLSEIDEMLRG